MMVSSAENQTFRQGDEVVLVHGTYPGTKGVFLHLNKDANWAAITERSGDIRSHPVRWLAHCTRTTPVSVN